MAAGELEDDLLGVVIGAGDVDRLALAAALVVGEAIERVDLADAPAVDKQQQRGRVASS